MIRCPLITDNLIQGVQASGGPPASGLVRAAISLFAESGGSTAIHMPLRFVASVDRCLRRRGGFPAGYGPCQIPCVRASAATRGGSGSKADGVGWVGRGPMVLPDST